MRRGDGINESWTGKKSKKSEDHSEHEHEQEKWYFVTKIVLTYCEKKLF